MSNTTQGATPQQVVEIVQPLCANVFGTSPCTATGTADQKCFNTFGSCLDTPNYAGTDTLSLYFSHNDSEPVAGVVVVHPFLQSVSTAPTEVNFAASSRDLSPLGRRASVTIQMVDGIGTDKVVDPYLSGRTYDPSDRSTWWRKWLARNRNRRGMIVKVYDGYEGQALADMQKREYVLDRVEGPAAGGRVTIYAKDILSLVDGEKAQVPAASPGVLSLDITDAQTSFEIAGAVEADYPAPGKVRIGDEIIAYSAVGTSGTNVVLTVLARASDASTAAAHSQGDTVQLCVEYTDEKVSAVIADLLTTHGGIDAAYIDTTAWTAEADKWLALFRLNRLLSVPRSVSDVIGDISAQCLCNVWWDERTQEIVFRALRPPVEATDLLTDEDNLLADSVSLQEYPDERLTQVWAYYGIRGQTLTRTDEKNYNAARVVITEAEDVDVARIRKVFCDWYASGTLARSVAKRTIAQRVNSRRVITFKVDAKDRGYSVGDIVRIKTVQDVDAYGNVREGYWRIFSFEETEPGHVAQYKAEETDGTLRYGFIVADGTPDYGSATDEQKRNGSWLAGSDGLVAGDPPYRLL